MNNLKVLHWAIEVALIVFLVLEIATRDDITWISVVFWGLLVISIGLSWTLRSQRNNAST